MTKNYDKQMLFASKCFSEILPDNLQDILSIPERMLNGSVPVPVDFRARLAFELPIPALSTLS
jgi:hypothetical protein